MARKDGIDPKSIGAPTLRIVRNEVDVEKRNEVEPSTGRVIGQRSGHVAGLRRYLARGEITSRQHDAGQRFIDEWEDANRTAPLTADLDSVHGGGSDAAVAMHRLASKRIDASRKHDEAIRVLGPCYPLVADVLLSMGDPASWARRRGLHEKVGFGVLVISLDALAAHYAIS